MLNTRILTNLRNNFVRSQIRHLTKNDLKASVKKRKIGQPTYESHPHLLSKNDVVPAITAFELNSRREKLVDVILSRISKDEAENRKHVIVIPSATKQYMTDKIPYVFRQNSDFLYLSGCQEPDTCLVISVDSRTRSNSLLFLREEDSHSELWDGPRTSCDDAIDFFGVSEALPTYELESFFRTLLKSKKPITFWYDTQNTIQNGVSKLIKTYLDNAFNKSWNTPKPMIHELRLIKSPAEIALMTKSCEIASKAISTSMKQSFSGISEHQIYAQIDHDCRVDGAEILAYPPVVAGGHRATVIHYINNNQLVHNGEMVLVDAGCEYHGYSSDITRTWPVCGTFSKHQLLLYEVLLSVQQDLIAELKSFLPLDDLLNKMYLSLGRRFQEAGVVASGRTDYAMIGYNLCPHHVSHYLGMDVHDTPTVSRSVPLKPGMILTVEPGIYINQHAAVHKDFHGIGIRIEDDILITDNGPVVLTAKCPKTVSDIERLMSKVK